MGNSSNVCQYEDCQTRSSFGYIGSNKAIYCSKHKQEGMIDVKHKTCQFEGCQTRSSFGYIGSKKAIYCSKHKQEGMMDIKHLKMSV